MASLEAPKIGHDNIDNQHQELFQVISMLDKAISTHDDEEINKIIQFLEHYVQDHFKEEETLMQKHQSPHFQTHKEEHEKFTLIVEDIRDNYDSGKSRTHLIFNIRRFMDLLVKHVQTVDILIEGLHDA